MIEVSELTKYYGARKAVGPLTFRIEQGEVVGLLGLNGAGKTTTLRMLSTDLLPTSGDMKVDGVDLVDTPEQIREKIGYLPDRPPLYGEMTVREYLTFAAKLRATANVKKRVDEVIDITDVGEYADERIDTLSHGFRQRVGISQAIVHKPKLLLLDEPISGLDPRQIVEMRDLIRSLRGEHTTVLSSHILSEIEETCDRILVIRNGEIIASGTETELTSQVQAGLNVELTLRVPESYRSDPVTTASDVVNRVDAVTGVVALPPDEAGARLVKLRVAAREDVREEICRRLIEAEIGLLALERGPRELESIFMRLTHEEDA